MRHEPSLICNDFYPAHWMYEEDDDDECYDDYLEPETYSKFLSLDFKDLEESLMDTP